MLCEPLRFDASAELCSHHRAQHPWTLEIQLSKACGVLKGQAELGPWRPREPDAPRGRPCSRSPVKGPAPSLDCLSPESSMVTWSHSWGQTLRKLPPGCTLSPDGRIYLSQPPSPCTDQRGRRERGRGIHSSGSSPAGAPKAMALTSPLHVAPLAEPGHGQPLPAGDSALSPRLPHPGPHLCKQTPHQTLPIPAERAICFLRGYRHQMLSGAAYPHARETCGRWPGPWAWTPQRAGALICLFLPLAGQEGQGCRKGRSTSTLATGHGRNFRRPLGTPPGGCPAPAQARSQGWRAPQGQTHMGRQDVGAEGRASAGSQGLA